MDKKRAVKLLSATAIAASAFVATSPAQAASTNNDAASLVQKAKQAGTVLKWAISTEGSADGTTRPWAQYNAAKAARDKAVAAVNKLPEAQKAGYLADIEQNVTLHINRTMAYIDAITAGEKIKVKKEALEKQIASNLIDDNTEAAYHALSTEIRKQAILLDRVYGKSTRDEIRKAYKQSAETVRDSVKYEVTVKIELDLAKKALADNNTADVEKHLAEAAKYMKEVKNEAMKATLSKVLVELEAQLTPQVKSVSAVNAKEILVTFNKEVDKATAETLTSYQLQGSDLAAPTTVTLQSDKKSVIIEHAGLVNGQSYTLKVKKDLIRDAKDTAKTVAEFSQTIYFNDTVKPTVSSIETLENGKVKVKFSERIDTATKPSVVINGTAIVAGKITVDASGLFATVDPSDLTLTKGSSYQIIVTGAQDIASTPNVMSLYSGTFVYSVVSEAPVVKSVTAKGEKTLVVQFSEDLSTALVDGTTVKVTKNGNTVTGVVTAVDGNNKFEVALPASIYGTGETSVNVAITLEGYKDPEGHVGTKFVQNVSLTKDVVAPAVKETKYDAAADRLTVKFDETLSAVTAATYAPNLYVTDSNGVRYNVSTTNDPAKVEVLTVADIAAGTDTLTLNTSELPNGTYTLTVLGDTFTDQAIAQNKNKVANVNFSVADSVATTKPEVQSAVISKGQIVLNFNTPLKGGNVAGSATNYANYSINGVVIPSTSSLYLDATKQQLTIKLPAGSVVTSGVKLLTVKGISGTNGVAMDEVTRAETFVDDTAPVLQSAKVDASNVLNVKFSEGLATAPVATTDLEVAINGTVITGYTAVAVAGKPGEYTITAPAGYSFATGTITVKVNATATAADSDANVLTTGTVVTATR